MDADDLPDILQPCEHIGEISSVNVHAIGGETLPQLVPLAPDTAAVTWCQSLDDCTCDCECPIPGDVLGNGLRSSYSECPMSSSDCLTSLVEAGVERNAVLPAPPDDPDPGPGEDADGVRMAAASGDRTSVDGVSPGVGHPAAVCEIHHCGSEFLVARPPEHDLFTFAGLPCRRRRPGQGG